MNTAEQARSRRLTAILEEAVGDGVAPDLARRIAARLADEPVRRRTPTLLVAAAVLAGIGIVVWTARLQGERARGVDASPAAVAQEPSAQDPARIVVHVHRLASAGAVDWRVGDQRFASPAELAKALHRQVADPAQRTADGDPLPLVIAAEAEVPWQQVLATCDQAMAAGLLQIGFDGIATDRITWKGTTPARDAATGLQLPTVQFQEPDDEPDARRPTFELRADGSVRQAGDVLVSAATATDADRAPLRDRLLHLRTQLLPAGEMTVGADDRKVLRVPLHVRADRAAPWASVQRLLQAALDPQVGFYRLEIAVAAGAAPGGDLAAPVETGR